TPYEHHGHKLGAKGTGHDAGQAAVGGGVQGVGQGVRGAFASGGRFAAFRQEGEGGLATAARLREKAWCDGWPAMAGASYLGYMQWAVGLYLDPPLEATCLGSMAVVAPGLGVMTVAVPGPGGCGRRRGRPWGYGCRRTQPWGLRPSPPPALRLRPSPFAAGASGLVVGGGRFGSVRLRG
ncbi:CocE/NonD family hydrolase, partial [Nonomuraea angiospora]